MTPIRTFGWLVLLTFLPPAFAADITGKWKGSMSEGGQVAFTLREEGGSITGNMLDADGKKGKPILEGKLKGDDISFSVESDWQGMPVVLLYKGKVSGNEMRLRIDADNGYWGTDAVVKKQ